MRFKSTVTVILAAMLAAAPSLAAEERLALVSSEGENSVTVLDLRSEKTIKVLPVGKMPHAMAASPDGMIFVNNRGSRELTVIDANRLEVAATIPLPAVSFQLSMSPDGKTVAVVYKDVLKLSLVDVADRRLTKTVEIGKEPAHGFKGPMMKHPYWTPDGRFIYVPDSVNQALVKVDQAAGAVVRTIAMPGVNHYLHPSPDGKLLYAVNEKTKDGTSLTLIDAATDSIVSDLPIPLAPGEHGIGHHAAFSPDKRFYFFCNFGGSGLHVLDVASRKWIKVIKTGMGPGHPALSPDGKYIFVVHHRDGVISVIDAAKQEFIKNIKVGEGRKEAHASYFTPDGNYFYAVAAEDNIMAKIDVARLEVAAVMPVAGASMFFEIKEGGTYPTTE